MTRKKAIEAALDWGLKHCQHSDYAEKSATRAYDLGRLAGLREGADFVEWAGGDHSLRQINERIAKLARRLKP